MFDSLFISCTRKSSFFPMGSLLSDDICLSWLQWLLSLVISSVTSILSANTAASAANTAAGDAAAAAQDAADAADEAEEAAAAIIGADRVAQAQENAARILRIC